MEKIAFFTLNLKSGGAERVVSNLCNEFVNQYTVILILFEDEINYPLDERVKIIRLSKIGDVKSNVLKFLLLPFYIYRLIKIIKKEKITKLYSYLLRPNVVSNLTKFFNKKLLVAISERSNPIAQYSSSSLSDKINRSLIRHIYPLANVITVNSYGSLNALREFYKIDKRIEVIHNPISPLFLSSQNIKLPNSKFEFISVGRLDEGKNHIMIVEAVKLLKDMGLTNFKVDIVGSGPLKDKIQSYIDRYNLNSYVNLLGHRSDVHELLQKSDCSLLVSNKEGFPNVVLESIASKTIVISTDCPYGPREILSNLNVLPNNTLNSIDIFDHGVLIPLNNAKILAEAMCYVLENTNKFYLTSNQELLKKYSINSIKIKVEKLL